MGSVITRSVPRRTCRRHNRLVHPPLPRFHLLRTGVTRRSLSGAVLGGLALHSLAGCAAQPLSAQPWEARLRGATVALLGEVHDNAEHHRQRSAVLRRALQAGWRPAVVMEQFDTDRQADIERSRTERPLDAQHLIANAGAPRGWVWDHYVAPIALILQFELPLLAGNLPRALAARLTREGFAAVLGAERTRELGLNEAPEAQWQAAQEREIDLGHCGALPRHALAGMARAQFARDAVMAQLLREHAARGAVLLAGTGHVRRDIGVPRWLLSRSGFAGLLNPPPGADDVVVGLGVLSRKGGFATFLDPLGGRSPRSDGLGALTTQGAAFPQTAAPGVQRNLDKASVLAVGFIEADVQAPAPNQFDAVVIAPAAQRDDPCEAFKARPQRPTSAAPS